MDEQNIKGLQAQTGQKATKQHNPQKGSLLSILASHENSRRLMMTIYGYARVSTDDQNLDLQLDALQKAGCDTIYQDIGVSAAARNRDAFDTLFAALQDGDTLIIWKMDRAFRSLRHALDMLEIFEHRQIEFRSLTDQIDTTTLMGKCMYQIRNAFAELERSLISERTKAGMEAARSRGKHIGRPKALSKRDIKAARKPLSRSSKTTKKEIAATLGVS